MSTQRHPLDRHTLNYYVRGGKNPYQRFCKAWRKLDEVAERNDDYGLRDLSNDIREMIVDDHGLDTILHRISNSVKDLIWSEICLPHDRLKAKNQKEDLV